MPQPYPQHICDRARRLAEVHPSHVVSELTGVSQSVLYRMKRRNWKAPRTTHPLRQRPTDYAIRRKYMTIDEAAAHYKTSTRAIVRWDREMRA